MGKWKKLRLTPVWSNVCLAKSSFLVKGLWQTSHLNGVTPSWTNFLCTVRRAFRLNVLPQSSQLKPFSPVWWKICARSCAACINDLLQYWQTCGFSPVWILWWRFNVSLAANLFWHWNFNGTLNFSSHYIL